MALVLQKPNFSPYVCYVCGVNDERRKWYVDLQLPVEHYLNPVNDGAIYLCNECWESLAVSVAKQAQEFLFGLEPWSIGEYVEPTYDNETVLKVKHVESRAVPGNRDIDVINSTNAGIPADVEGDNQEPERNDPTPNDDTTPSDTDGDSEPDADDVKLGNFFSGTG